MDAGLAWTIVGSVAGVAAVVIGGLQLWQPHRADEQHLPADRPDAEADNAAGIILPPPLGRLPKHVQGRDDLVRMLVGLAAAPDGRVHVLAGLGGCGKSTVALEVARRAAEAGSRVWWVPAVDTGVSDGAAVGPSSAAGRSDRRGAGGARGADQPV